MSPAARRTWGEVFVWGLAVVLCAGLVVVARDDVLLIVLGVAAAVVLAVFVVLGPERAGTVFVVLGTFTAPMSALVVPQATFVTATDLLFAVGFIFLLPTILGRNIGIPPAFSLTAMACLFIGVVASLATPDWLASFNFQARFVAGVLVVPLVFLAWRPRLPVVKALAVAYIAGTAVSFIGGVARGDRPGERFIGFTEHPNVLGLTGLFATGLCVFMISQTRRSLAWIWLAGGAMGLGIVWFSGSRAALVVAAVIALLFPVVERSARAAGLLLGSGTVAVVVASQIKLGSGSALDRLFGGGSADWSDAEREQLFQHYWQGFLDRPLLGHGFEEAVLGHNVYLQIAYSMGIFGALAFVLLILVGAAQLLAAPKPFNRLAYPILSYAMVAPLTSVVWDRYIWVPAALAFVVAADVGRVRAGQPGDILPAAAPAATPTAAPGAAEFVRGRWTGPTRISAVAPLGHGPVAADATSRGPFAERPRRELSRDPGGRSPLPAPAPKRGKRRADVPVDGPSRAGW